MRKIAEILFDTPEVSANPMFSSANGVQLCSEMCIFVQMKPLSKENKRENRLYLLIWVAVFVIGALMTLLQGLSRQEGVSFANVLQLWLRIVPFLVLFLLHNYLVAPLLLRRRKPVAYGLATVALLVAFGAFVLLVRTGPVPARTRQGQGTVREEAGMMVRQDPAAPRLEPAEPRPDQMEPRLEPFGGFRPEDAFRRGHRRGPRPMEMLKILLGIMMLATNMGIKFQFQSMRNAARVQELETENLQHRLDTLRYQINPHFFMNTLNNIHALVDLDPEKAKESIVELSRLMRHILYDSGSPTIPLSQELEFLRHYVSLMRLRYPEGVDISLLLPEHDGGAQVPPLVFASFVENAFKHGVSYESPSYVHISVAVEEGKVLFKCANSRQTPAERKDGSGIGQENARRRLDLLYGDRYLLHIDEPAGAYELLLVVPAQPEIPEAL